MSTEIDPIQLAVKYDPPQLALIYVKGGETLVHQFGLREEDLDEEAEIVFNRLKKLHPGYLDDIRSEQVIRLLEMIQQHQSRPDSQDRSPPPLFSANHRRLDPFKGFYEEYSSQGEEFDDGPLGDDAEHIDFMAIERDLEKGEINSDEESV